MQLGASTGSCATCLLLRRPPWCSFRGQAFTYLTLQLSMLRGMHRMLIVLTMRMWPKLILSGAAVLQM